MEEGFKTEGKIEQKLKEEFLEESFKKAEVSRGLRRPYKKTPEENSSLKNSFPTLGFILIIIAIIGLMIIHNIPYNVPWAFVKYDTGNGEIETYIYKDFKESDIMHQEIINLFRSPGYIGITIDDFTDAPKSANYGFISIIILGIAFITFGILDKIQRFSKETFVIIHSIFATATIMAGTFIVLLAIKFLGAHFLMFHNESLIFQNSSSAILLFPAAFILIIIGFITIKIMLTILKINFKELEKMAKPSVSEFEHSFSHPANGGRSQ